MTILNLTQHNATKDQLGAGIVDLPEHERELISKLLTFNTLEETAADAMEQRADAIAAIARSLGADAAMIGGAPFFMSTLESSLKCACVQPYYAFTQRVSVDKVGEDGQTVKTSVSKHMGLIPA